MKITTIICLFLSIFSFAKETRWSTEELKRRFEVRGEMYDLDPSGKIALRKGHTWNVWKPIDKEGKVESQWSSQTEDYTIAIKHNWQVLDDGTIKVSVEQFKKVKRLKDDVEFSESQNKFEKVIENMEPITFVVYQTPEKRVVVRLTPDFAPGESAKAVTDMPVSGQDVMITDNEGYVWGQHASNGGKYSGFCTYKGTAFLSYYPFPGSKEFGVASGNEILIHLNDKKTLTLTSKTAYLPEGLQAKVYGIYYPDRKCGKYPSVALMDRSDEKGFVERIKTWPK